MERQDLSCTYLAHYELESVVINSAAAAAAASAVIDVITFPVVGLRGWQG